MQTIRALQKYWAVWRVSLLDLLEYRTNFAITTAKYTMMIFMMAMLWISVGRQAPLSLNANQLIVYFFWASVLYSISNFHPYYIEDDIRLGTYARFLVKPIKPFKFYLAFESTQAISGTVLRLAAMLPIILLLGIQITLYPSDLILGIIFGALAFIFSFEQLSFIAGLSFWITEAWAIRWGYMVVVRFLAGLLVPIAFFPEWAQRILYWTPFPHLAATPIAIMQHELTFSQIGERFIIILAWTLGVSALRRWQWQRGSRSFEATGL